MPASIDSHRHFIPLSQLDSSRANITVFDPHIHTNFSPDGQSHWRDVLRTGQMNWINAMAITDHDTVRKHKKMAQFAEKLKILFISGVELTTTYKNRFPHIILLNAHRELLKDFLKNAVVTPSDMPMPLMLRKLCYVATVYPYLPRLEAVVEWLTDNPSVIAVAAHPRTEMHWNRSAMRGLDADSLTSITLNELEAFLPTIRGIEVINSLPNRELDTRRLDFAKAHALIPFGGSDAHHEQNVGSVVTWVEGTFSNVHGLLHALQNKPIGTAYVDGLQMPNW